MERPHHCKKENYQSESNSCKNWACHFAITNFWAPQKHTIVNGFFYVNGAGPMASKYDNLYVTIVSLVVGRYGVPHVEMNGTE